MSNINEEKSCCFFGHRKIDETTELKDMKARSGMLLAGMEGIK